MQLSPYRHGYTLIELAIVIGIIGIMLSSGIEVSGSYFEARRINVTQERLEVIDNALVRFARQHGYLPCPADGRVAPDSTLFGIAVVYDETADPGSCGDPQGAVLTGYAQFIGEPRGVPPVRTLGLANDMMFDGWGKKLSYHVSDGLGHDPDLVPEEANDFDDIANQGNLDIINAAGEWMVQQGAAEGNIVNAHGAAYVLLSHGANGEHAWSRNGTKIDRGTASAREDDNGDDETGANSVLRYVQDDKSTDFDDMLRFRHKWQIEGPRKRVRPMTLPAALEAYVTGVPALGSLADSDDEAAVQRGLDAMADLYVSGVDPITPRCPRNLVWQTDTNGNNRYDNGPAEGACVCAGLGSDGAPTPATDVAADPPVQNFVIDEDRFGACVEAP